MTPQERVLMVWEARMSGDEALAEQYRTQMWDAIDRKTLRLVSQAITPRDQANDLKVAADEVSAAYPELATDAQAQSDLVTYREFRYFQKGVPFAEALRVSSACSASSSGGTWAPSSSHSRRLPHISTRWFTYLRMLGRISSGSMS
jgi:hypothetical protein